jgi:hypothetical protein
MIYYSTRPIKAGEEICMTYRTIWAELSEDEDCLQRFVFETSLSLKFKWGIFCPSDCICNDANMLPVFAESSRLTRMAAKFGSEGDFERSLAASKKKLQLCNTHPRLMGIQDVKLSTLFDAFGAAISIKDKKRFEEATAFVKEINEIIGKLEFPGSVKSLSHKRLLNNPPSKEAIKKRFLAMTEEHFKENVSKNLNVAV